MVHSTSPSPLVIIPHGDFEKQATQRLDDALTSGLIKQAKYRDLCNDLQWVLPFQQALFNIHLNDQIPSPQSHLSNSNVQPSSAASAVQFTVEIDPAANESGDYITTHDLDDEVPPSSVDILSSTPSPRQIPPPTSVPAVIDNLIPTPFSVHDHVCSSPVPCRDLTATTRPIQTDTNNLAQSASSNSLNHRISHIKNILRDLPRITFGKHVFLLPPIPTTSIQKCISAPTDPIQKSLSNSEAHISQSDLSLQLQVQNPQPENPHSAIITPKVQLDARRSSAYISTVVNQFCPKSSILAESANIKVNTSHLLLFNPQCDHIQSSIIDLYPSSIPSAPVRLMSIPSFHVGTFQFPDTPKHLSSFQSPAQYAIENSYSEFSVPLRNIDAAPDIDPEPPPWITYLCLVFIILVRFRISLWGSNSMSLSFLELSCTHELVNQISRACADCSITSTNMPDAML